LKNIFFAHFVAFACTIANLAAANNPPAFEWPVEREKKYQISSTFGESRLDHFHNGVDIPGAGAKVLVPKAGRLLYRINAEFTPGEMPFGGGTTLVIDHGTHWSGFMHLQSVAENIAKQPQLSVGERIGTSGNSGHSGGPHLHFFIFDPHERAMLNPLTLMSDLYYRDTKPPEAKDWGVLLPDKFASVNPAKSFRLSADYPVYVFIQDHGTGRERWGVFDYRVTLDGKEAIAAKFDKVFFKGDAWQLTNGLAFEDIFFRNYYALTPKVRRAKKVLIEAKDWKGNSLSKTYELQIQQN